MNESASLYDRVGGQEFFEQLTTVFYQGVVSNEILRPMYPPDDLTHAREKLKLFLMQYWGGPDEYSQKRGHPRLRMRHAPFVIDDAARQAWLTCMRQALESTSIEQPLKDEMWEYFVMAANAMVNTSTQPDR
jgi:hemoglobin